jgi:hypothetical protein
MTQRQLQATPKFFSGYLAGRLTKKLSMDTQRISRHAQVRHQAKEMED